MINLIRLKLIESIEVKQKILSDPILLRNIARAVEILSTALANNNRVFLCGNGGSAADAQHIAAELVVKFYKNRKPLPALALHQDPSTFSATANDLGYEHVFERQIEAHGRKDDVLIAISTSGKSTNVNLAVKKAKQMGLKVIYLCGKKMPSVSNLCDVVINIPSNDTPRIQEAHITVGHIMVELIESKLFE